jgi:NADH:ubiquinone oxidoreductase subunit
MLYLCSIIETHKNTKTMKTQIKQIGTDSFGNAYYKTQSGRTIRFTFSTEMFYYTDSGESIAPSNVIVVDEF